MATIKFITRSKVSKLVPLYVRFTDGRQIDIKVPTPFRIRPEYWSNDTQSLRQRITYTEVIDEREAKEILDKITQLKDEILKEHFKLTGSVTREWLQQVISNAYFKEKPGEENLNQYIKRFIEEATSGKRLCETGKSRRRYSAGTLRTFRDFRNVFNLYQGIYEQPKRKAKNKQEEKRPYKPVGFDDITIDFYNGMLQFFYSRGCGANYAGKIFKVLKTIMRAAREENLHTNAEIERKAFKVLREDVDSIYLTESELVKMYALDLSENKHLEVARDIFLIGCYTAQRYSDYSRISAENIKTYEGKRVIQIIQKKTGEKVIIPIRHELELILQKYDYSLPKTYEQKINKYIKTVGKMAGINEDIQIEENKGGLIVKKTVKKYEMIKTHCARRTGCTLMYKAKIPVIDIMKFSGHRKESEFLKYIKVSKEETAVHHAENPFFVGRLKVS